MSHDFSRIAKAIRYLEAHAEEQPGLEKIAAEVGMSEHHFQRLFRRWAGVSPKRFLQFASAEKAGSHLMTGDSALEAAWATGLSGPGRLHDLAIAATAATPGEIKSGGKGLDIRWGVHETPLGPALIATTDRGICEFGFFDAAGEAEALAEVRERWPAARMRHDPVATAPLIERIFGESRSGEPISLYLKGTNFQLQVWRALLDIPPGGVTSYGEVARRIGAPSAARAVGGAVGANRIAVLIPCHRVIRATAAFGNYRWGIARKKALLAWERFPGEE